MTRWDSKFAWAAYFVESNIPPTNITAFAFRLSRPLTLRAISRRLQNLLQGRVDPLFILEKIGKAFQWSKRRIVRPYAGCLQNRVVLKGFRENFPPNRINGPILTWVNYEWV